MSTALQGFDTATAARLKALHERVRRIYPDPAHRYLDHYTACWVAFWRWLNDPAMCAVRNRSEWAGELVDVTFSVKESRGVTYTSVTLRDCLTVAGLTREQALRNLDEAARRYANSLEHKPHGPHGKHQLAILHRYLMQRKETCPCEIEPCQCTADECIAH